MSDNEITVVNEESPGRRDVIKSMYNDYFLDYASYVILERAIPLAKDGLKPVQRRILHSMFSMDDGRFQKVANVIGNTMQFHPHGDAAIGDALVVLEMGELEGRSLSAIDLFLFRVFAFFVLAGRIGFEELACINIFRLLEVPVKLLWIFES